MITTLISDFSRVLLFPKDEAYIGGLNDLNRKLIGEFGEEYKFLDYFKLNEELLEVYKELTQKYPIYIFTKGTVQNRPEIKPLLDSIFTGIFSAKDFNLNKSLPESYALISRNLQKKPEEILYIDDQSTNLDAAKKAGMHVLQYENNVDVKKVLKLLLLVQ